MIPRAIIPLCILNKYYNNVVHFSTLSIWRIHRIFSLREYARRKYDVLVHTPTT